MRNIDILTAQTALADLIHLPMPIAAALRVRRITRQVDAIVQDIDAERRTLLERYAVHDENGELLFEDEGKTRYQVDPEFHRRYAELVNCECDAPLETLPADLLGSMVEITPALLLGLGDILTDGTDQ
jgi:hypothetical protein